MDDLPRVIARARADQMKVRLVPSDQGCRPPSYAELAEICHQQEVEINALRAMVYKLEYVMRITKEFANVVQSLEE